MERPQDKTAGRLDPLRLRRLDLAAVLSRAGSVRLTPQAINNWLASGCPRNSDRTFSIIAVCSWLAAQYGKRPQQPMSAEDDAVTVELKRERLRGLRQARLMQAGGLISRADFEQECLQKIHAIRVGLMSLPNSLALQLADQHDPQGVKKVIEDRVRELLAGFADGWEPNDEKDADEKDMADGDSDAEKEVLGED